jgi:hypothetical protein
MQAFRFSRVAFRIQTMHVEMLSLDSELAAVAERYRPLLFAANAQCQALASVPRCQGRERWKPHIDARFAELLVLKDFRA